MRHLQCAHAIQQYHCAYLYAHKLIYKNCHLRDTWDYVPARCKGILQCSGTATSCFAHLNWQLVRSSQIWVEWRECVCLHLNAQRIEGNSLMKLGIFKYGWLNRQPYGARLCAKCSLHNNTLSHMHTNTQSIQSTIIVKPSASHF